MTGKIKRRYFDYLKSFFLQLVHPGYTGSHTNYNYTIDYICQKVKLVQLKADRKGDYLILVRYILLRNKK